MPEELQQRVWPRWTWACLLAALTAATFLLHGYHPLAEDGGLYVAGVKWLLNPSLFPHDRAFVTAHLRYSIFAPVVVGVVRLLHLPLLWALFLLSLASIAGTLLAARRILQRCGMSDAAQLGGVALLAAWWTMPVAGTSLLLMDPYVTARSFSTPLSLFAVAWAMDDWRSRRPALLCAAALIAAAAFHPLMAAYAVAMVIVLRLGRGKSPIAAWLSFALVALCAAAVLQVAAHAESAAVVAAAYSRYYWFLSQWQWFEWLGLLGPLVVIGAIMQWSRRTDAAMQLMKAAIVLGLLAFTVALLFAHEGYRSHAVARLQPLRAYLQVYALMALLLGAVVTESCRRGWRRSLPVLLVLGSAVAMFTVQRLSFPASPHVELPWRADANPNGWVQAFLWARDHTPNDALFALDAKYVNTEGEDAQVFRAIAERSMLPDFSKDGGEAAITPSLANAWQRGAAAQKALSAQTDAEREAQLRPLGVTWMVLHADAVTTHPCAYRNAVVKVCELPR